MAQAKYYAEFTITTGADQHTYRVYKEQLGYQLAAQYATSLTGDPTKSYLVSPGSAQENAAVLAKTSQYITPGAYPNDYIWTGGRYSLLNWKFAYNGETIDRNGPNYNNWNTASYFNHAAAVADPNVENNPDYMAMGLNGFVNGFTGVPGEWYAKDNTPYSYVVEIEPGFTPNYLNINTIEYNTNKDAITDYSRTKYNGGIRINSDQLTNFSSYQDWTYTSVNKPKKLSKASKQDYDFVYYKKTGDLYYNENTDAKGWGAGGAFAQFENRPRLTSDQITLYTDLGPAI